MRKSFKYGKDLILREFGKISPCQIIPLGVVLRFQKSVFPPLKLQKKSTHWLHKNFPKKSCNPGENKTSKDDPLLQINEKGEIFKS